MSPGFIQLLGGAGRSGLRLGWVLSDNIKLAGGCYRSFEVFFCDCICANIRAVMLEMTPHSLMQKSACAPSWLGLRRWFCVGYAVLVRLVTFDSWLDAQEASPNLHTRTSGFITRGWDAEDGLPHNAVNKVIRDRHGFLWVATQLGLARFDGRQFVTYRVPDDFTLGGYNIRALALEDDHTLLMLTGGDKLVRLRDGVFELHPANGKMEGSRMRELAVDENGDIWIGTETSKCLRWNGNELQTFGAAEGVNARGASFTFANGQQKRLWVAGGDFLGWHDEEGLHEYAHKTGNSFYVAPARSGGVWVAAREHLAKIENNRWRIVYSETDWPARRLGIQDIFEADDGALWIATKRDGVFRLVDGVLTHVPMPQERAMSITDDIDGNVWLGMHGGGLVRAKPQRHVLLNTAAGLPSDVSSSVCEDGNGALWCANQSGGLVRMKNGNISIATMAAAESIPYISSVCADKHGRIWAGSVSGLYWTTVKGNGPHDGGGERWLLQHYAGRKGQCAVAFCASNGDLWVSWGGRHLGVLRAGKMHEFTQTDGFHGERVMESPSAKMAKSGSASCATRFFASTRTPANLSNTRSTTPHGSTAFTRSLLIAKTGSGSARFKDCSSGAETNRGSSRKRTACPTKPSTKSSRTTIGAFGSTAAVAYSTHPQNNCSPLRTPPGKKFPQSCSDTTKTSMVFPACSAASPCPAKRATDASGSSPIAALSASIRRTPARHASPCRFISTPSPQTAAHRSSRHPEPKRASRPAPSPSKSVSPRSISPLPSAPKYGACSKATTLSGLMPAASAKPSTRACLRDVMCFACRRAIRTAVS
ncbi:hypothetical protein OH491_00170 [Termitidicoccus mucosus]